MKGFGHGLVQNRLTRNRQNRRATPVITLNTLRQVLLGLLLTLPGVLVSAPALAQDKLNISMVYITRAEEPPVPLSLLDLPIERNGVSGAELGLNDNQTTGQFLGHEYALEEIVVAPDDDITAAVKTARENGAELFLADLRADDLLAAADAAGDALVFNTRAQDDRLRNEDCRVNVLHIPPSRAMLADALMQYLAWKRWTDVALIVGRHPEDEAYAAALRRAAKRFGIKIDEEKPWTSVPGARRTDSGHHSAQQEIPAFTQMGDHDVLLVADERDEFGEYLTYRTTLPRPVAGTQGLMPSAWHRTQEQWGATQIQRRFEELAGRPMTARDYAAWAAMRSIGEAVTRTSSGQGADIEAFILSEDFTLAAFKGVPLTYRSWNGQLRQPVLLVAPRMLISVSPQDGFLHQFSELDTLGFDEPESSCEAFDS